MEKIKIEALWNELIVAKFSSRIKINENELRQKITNESKAKIKSYLMSEILFEVNQIDDLETKFKKIDKTISEQGFENAALKYSISQTSSIGGKLDWINENA